MLKFARRFKSATNSSLIRSDLPQSLTKVAASESHYYELKEYQQSSLKNYFDQDALLFPVETIIQKSSLKDYKFFLEQRNFLKVVDTLEKFEEGMLDQSSELAREFIVFKRQLYKLYEVKNRSIHEHELYSFKVERENLKWIYKANLGFLDELASEDAIEHAADQTQLKGAVFRKKLLNPSRLKGVAAFATSLGIYSYLPYLAVYLGSTVPVITACAAGIYGLLEFGETNVINKIHVVNEGENAGKLRITVGQTALASRDMIVDVRDIKSVLSLSDNDLGRDNLDSNLVVVSKHFDEVLGKQVEEEALLKLPADAYRDRVFIDWILNPKEGEGELALEYHNLIHQRFLEGSKIQINALTAYNVPAQTALGGNMDDEVLENLIETKEELVEEKLKELQQIYGQEYLKSLEDSDLYKLYRKHSA